MGIRHRLALQVGARNFRIAGNTPSMLGQVTILLRMTRKVLVRMVIPMTLACGLVGVATISQAKFVAGSDSQPRGDSGLPTVTGATVPLYPPIARAASLQGIVVLVATISGSKVETMKVLSGHPLLTQAAESNIRTWTFISKPPQSMKIIYRYEISEKCEGDPSVKLDFPSEVTVCTKPSPPLD